MSNLISKFIDICAKDSILSILLAIVSFIVYRFNILPGFAGWAFIFFLISILSFIVNSYRALYSKYKDDKRMKHIVSNDKYFDILYALYKSNNPLDLDSLNKNVCCLEEAKMIKMKSDLPVEYHDSFDNDGMVRQHQFSGYIILPKGEKYLKQAISNREKNS
jgi:hypothetical protein